MSKLSIITINYNNAAGLEKTVQSVISQTYKNYEYIIIDGGSNDGSIEVIGKQLAKINYWVSEKDTGIYNAMNKGIKKAQGEYLLFLNSGDFLIHQNILQDVFLLKNDEDILYGELIFDFGNEDKKLTKLPNNLTVEYLFRDNIWHPASFIKKQLFQSIGVYNESYKIAADYDFFFHAIAIKEVTTKYISFPISVYNTKGLSSSPQNFKKIDEERADIHKSYLSQEKLNYLNSLKVDKNKSFFKSLLNKVFALKIIRFILKFRNYIK